MITNKITFTDIPINFVKEVISENQQINICNLYEIMNLYKDLYEEMRIIKKRIKKIDKIKIYAFIADTYCISPEAVRQFFFRKLRKIIENENN
jgi:hypothetical protein